MIQNNKLQYISQGEDAEAQLFSIMQVLDAGCTWIQLRYKQRKDPQFMKLAEDVKRLTETYKAVYIVNDFPEVAKEIDADGVHLGLHDREVGETRKFLGEDKIIGGTANTYSEVLQRIDEKCDYVGVGPFRYTKTKENLSPILGIDGYKNLVSKMEKARLNIPIYAVGGIQMEDILDLRKEKIHGIAISEMITRASKPKTIVEHVYRILYETI